MCLTTLGLIMVNRENLKININILLFRFIQLVRLPLKRKPVKTSKDLKQKYFNFTFIDDTNIHHGVCFSPEKHKLFSTIEDKQSSNSGIELKKFKLAENDNIMVNNFTSAKQIDLHFEKKK